MSATEILDGLSKLTPAELEIIYRRAVELHQGHTLEASPELVAAIDVADQSFAKEGKACVSASRRGSPHRRLVKYEVIIARSALRDVEQIRAYIARENPAAAETFGSKNCSIRPIHYAHSRNEVGLSRSAPERAL